MLRLRWDSVNWKQAGHPTTNQFHRKGQAQGAWELWGPGPFFKEGKGGRDRLAVAGADNIGKIASGELAPIKDCLHDGYCVFGNSSV